MRTTNWPSLAFLALLLVPTIALACLWDYDTLQMERSRFPTALELITGKFLRHSYSFYQWRIRDRLAWLERDPDNMQLRDDLAVAYDKAEQHDKAIATALDQLKRQPRRYETEANLGSFYIHAGRPKEGLPHIEAALRINPDAHFGREKYQKLLVEYLLKRREKENTPSSDRNFYEQLEFFSFPSFIADHVAASRISVEEQAAAVQGVLGMMRFGNFESPALLEALASLLGEFSGGPTKDAKQLAARAYLKASYLSKEPKDAERYRESAKTVLHMQTRGNGSASELPLEELEQSFRGELAQAAEWYADLEQREAAWIHEGTNPDEEFAKLYSQDPSVDVPEVQLGSQRFLNRFFLGSGSVVLVALLVGLFSFLIRRVVQNFRKIVR